LYKISTPPDSDITGWHGFHSDDAGYIELRKLFDYLKDAKQIGPKIAGREKNPAANGDFENDDDGHGQVEICLVDAEDLLRDPEKTCKAYCKSVGLQFHPSMLSWTSDDHRRAEAAFQKSWALHVNALSSISLKPRVYVSISPRLSPRPAS
jgi:hypothetical protein